MNPNPGLLKFDLAIRGARLGRGVQDHPEITQLAEQGDYVARTLELVLPEDVWVSVPIGDRFTAASPYELSAAGNVFVVDGNAQRCEVRCRFSEVGQGPVESARLGEHGYRGG